MALMPKTQTSLGLSPPKWQKTCPRSGRTAIQNFTLISKARAEKYVTVQNEKQKNIVILVSRPYYVWRDNDFIQMITFQVAQNSPTFPVHNQYQ